MYMTYEITNCLFNPVLRWIRVGCLYQELLLNMKTVLTNFLILSFLPRVKMVKYHVHALIAVIKYGLIGRRLERISNVSGLLKATELHLLFPNHVKLLCWMLKMTCKGWCMMHSTGLVRTYMKMK
ncbi:hypothetical protein HanRHA438_Chr05g0228591 [Helianthus annuus]|nr:hypothetical protein HanRHA438_Chr05g0228591 [Helianthus annuus]